MTNLNFASMHLIGYLSNELPPQIGSIMDSGVPTLLNNMLEQTQLELLNPKQVQIVFSFYSNICLKEEGFETFNKFGLNTVERLLRLVPNSTKEVILKIADGIILYVEKIGNSSEALLAILHNFSDNFRKELFQQLSQLNKDSIVLFQKVLL